MDRPISLSLSRRAALVALYAAYALAVYILQGPRPPISIDHIAYFKLADQIRADHPTHDYWRAISVTHSYAVIMAYLYGLTADHVKTLKVLLAAMTVCYLWSAEILFCQFTGRRWIAVLFAFLSAFHVSLGSVFWGVTDFQASLNRTLAVPPMLLLLAWYLESYDRSRRYAVYPALVFLSILHLGTYYLLGVLVCMDGFRLLRCLGARPRSFIAESVPFLSSLGAVALAYAAMQPLNLDRSVLSRLLPHIESRAMPSGHSKDFAEEPVLTSHEAWEMELFAQPWRNFPIPAATLLAAVMSLAWIVPLSFAGGSLAVRATGWRRLDGAMILMAACVLVCAYGLQSTLWALRHWFRIYPINFEEMRTVSLIYLPILYFAIRAFEWMWCVRAGVKSRRIAAAGVALFLLQPIVVVRFLPTTARIHLFRGAQQLGVLDNRNSQRNMYARQVLRLETPADRFYYSLLPTIGWLRERTNADSRILTNRDEIYLLPATVVGTSNGFLNTDSRSPARLAWQKEVLALQNALASHDGSRVRILALQCGAKFAVVPWKEDGAVFADGAYSVISVQ